jgi:hypothetical protein
MDFRDHFLVDVAGKPGTKYHRVCDMSVSVRNVLFGLITILAALAMVAVLLALFTSAHALVVLAVIIISPVLILGGVAGLVDRRKQFRGKPQARMAIPCDHSTATCDRRSSAGKNRNAGGIVHRASRAAR